MDPVGNPGMRLDKWLWAARFFKTRALAVEAIERGRVRVNGQGVKPARDLRPGDRVEVLQGAVLREVVVRALSHQRGPAPQAQTLYEETASSVERRMREAEQRRLAPEPAATLEQGRPTKRDRRQLDHAQRGWNDRWSASIDD